MAEEEQQEAPKKKKGLIKWIVLALLILGLAGGGYFAYVTFFASPDGEKAGETAAPSPENIKGYKDLVTLSTFVVNLADPLGRRYLKLGMDVEVIDQRTVNDLKQNESRVRDAVILLLSSKTYNEIGTTEGQILLRKEIVERLNQVLGGPKVLRVYFTEMVVQ